MSHRKHTWLTVAGALACAAGAFYWLHGRNAQTPIEVASAADSTPLEAAGTRAPANATGKTPPASAEVKEVKKDAAAEAGLPLRAGEVLEYSADVSTLSKVANLKLQVIEKSSFLGKSAWHLQAFAHTENPLRMVFALDDQFDSYSDAVTMTSLQYEMRLNERGQKVESLSP